MTQTIDNVIKLLTEFSKDYEIKSLFISGEYCRSVYLDQIEGVKKIEVISAYPEQAIYFGSLFASEVANVTPEIFKKIGKAQLRYNDSHGDLMIEFQGLSTNLYMKNHEILSWLEKNKINDVPLINNIYGREFTIDGLLYSIYNNSFMDILDRSAEDFRKKLVNPILPPDLLIKYNPLSILKGIKISLMYDFYIEKNFRQSIKEGINLLPKTVSRDKILSEIVSIVQIDPEKAVEVFKKLDFYKILPEKDMEQIFSEKEIPINT